MKLEEQQEINLHQNWKTRQSVATLIGKDNALCVYECKIDGGARVFYLVEQGTPLAYMRCHELKDGVQVSSTYVTTGRQKQGLATFLYRQVIPRVGKLVSDWDRLPGADALWACLERDASIVITYDENDNQFTAIPY